MRTYICIILLTALAHAETEAQAQSPYRDIQQKLRRLVNQYPNRVEIFELTRSNTGIPVEGISIRPEGSDPRHLNPQVVVSGHHGDEWGSIQVVMAFAADLASRPIDGKQIYLIPVLMPEGYNSDSRRMNGIDPNRDYQGPCGTHNQEPGQQAYQFNSTRALSEFVDQNGVTAALTVHNPWGTTHSPWSDEQGKYTEEHAVFQSLFQQAYANTSYQHSTVPDIAYTMHGNFIDHVFWEYGVWGLLVEVAGGRRPSPSELQREIDINLRAFRYLLENVSSQRSTRHGHPGCNSSPAEAKDSLSLIDTLLWSAEE